ncbi:hypothetical protein CMU71_13825 [Elizabethkingia anophelis]|uniref:hypothetical protein n=1 Tax=Elizabethkingia anophelis TaxID=1117645 RepID=UPI001F4B9DFC|nr:hypothetical protein [Elizabethkingia anophelis]MDV3567977.1 hypothetical protein [Elizabethkingia anophelis]MDV3969611.1 hypothetical protein [Elizabethkingia anophelis]
MKKKWNFLIPLTVIFIMIIIFHKSKIEDSNDKIIGFWDIQTLNKIEQAKSTLDDDDYILINADKTCIVNYKNMDTEGTYSYKNYKIRVITPKGKLNFEIKNIIESNTIEAVVNKDTIIRMKRKT